MDKLTTQQKEKFKIMLEELKAWNAHTNLTAIREDADIILKHFEDSLSVLPAIPETAKSLIDVGSGAGFPGLPIAIVRPDLKITLVEVVKKKVDFLEHIVKKLELTNVVIICARAEELGHENIQREKYDVSVARAVAKLPTLLEYMLPITKIGGFCVAQKSIGQEEIEEAENAIKILGGVLEKTIPVEIAGLENRQLIVIKKIKETPKEYPRRTGLPLKKPL